MDFLGNHIHKRIIETGSNVKSVDYILTKINSYNMVYQLPLSKQH